MAATVTKEKSIEDIVKGALRLEQIKKQDGKKRAKDKNYEIVPSKE